MVRADEISLTDKGDSPIFVDHGCAAVPAKIGTVPKGEPSPPAPLPKGEGRTWRRRVMAACVAASALLVVLASIVWLRPRPMSDDQPEKVIARQEPSLPQPLSEEEAEAYISRQTRVARLAVAVELLATQPGLETYRIEAEKYLAQVSGNAGQIP